jgi:hypothetical protein
MREHIRRWGLVGVALAVALWLVAAVGNSPADDKKKDDKDDKEEKELRDNIEKLANAIQNKKEADIKKLVKAFEKTDLEDIMGLQSLRSKDGTGGLGIGPKPGAIKPWPDGIDACLRDVLSSSERKLKPKDLADRSKALVKACYTMAAIAAAAKDKCPVTKKEAGKDPADWAKWITGMNKDAIGLAKELEKNNPNPDSVKTAATKLYNNCTSCHAVFKTS